MKDCLVMKTEWYENHKKLIYKMAWIFSLKTSLETDELISEFNIVFCIAYNKFNPDKQVNFGTFLSACCANKARSLIKQSNTLKRKMVEAVPEIDRVDFSQHDPTDSLIIYDNFVNNPNPVIQKIARIVSIYTLPKKRLKPWLRDILLKSFDMPEVLEAFNKLYTLYLK